MKNYVKPHLTHVQPRVSWQEKKHLPRPLGCQPVRPPPVQRKRAALPTPGGLKGAREMGEMKRGFYVLQFFLVGFYRIYGILIEGSLEVKLPTIWTDEKQSREEAERRERLEERRVEEKE